MKKTLLSALLFSLCATAHADPLSAWNDTAAKRAIEEWVTNATDADRATYIPPKSVMLFLITTERCGQKRPSPFRSSLRLMRSNGLRLNTRNGKTIPVKAVLSDDIKTVAAAGEKGLIQLLTLTHSNITTEEFEQRVSSWLDSHSDRRFGCRYDRMGYQPMRQLLDYLRANGFKTWIISGGGIDFMRVLSQKMYGIPPEQVVGSFSLSEFSLTDNGTTLRKTMKGAFNDDAANKPVAIHLFMGQRPVGAFGNSDGDLAMIQYTAANPDYKTFGLLVHHTDAAREYAYDSHPSPAAN